MNRVELGERLCQWHSSMSDPIYAVGSYYIDNKVYPTKEIVDDAIFNIKRDLEQSKCMLKGEKVMVMRHGKRVDLKEFAGYTNVALKAMIEDLSEIVSELERYAREDYAG